MRAPPSVLTVLFLAALASGAQIPQRRATVCNGHAELCDRPYGNVTFFGAHDSFAFSSDPLALAADQQVNLTQQLNLGARMLQAQSHIFEGELKFCHTSCLLFDGGTVQDYLTTVNGWLQENPNEVLTFLFTNPDGASLSGMWEPAFQASGITDLVYTPPQVPMAIGDWPTLGELIDNGTRVIVFLDAGADTDRSVPFILPEFEMVWETPFDSTDSTFPCSVNRTAGPLSTADHMSLLNHFLDINLLDSGILISDPEDAPTTNGVPSILANAAGCAPLASNRNPNFILLDFVNLGNGLEAVDQLNDIS
ncbi:PLC-like phosphodiesterase [Obba rivulosa]|uniref:PLC-like phosphodiesterase n=1 Tax=Obba rivulosa TaxID=1052685 RepID=A0A8E2B2U9_9APHY|nr:PLC-like phosphodiesterase [Obba rivulosa]